MHMVEFKDFEYKNVMNIGVIGISLGLEEPITAKSYCHALKRSLRGTRDKEKGFKGRK